MKYPCNLILDLIPLYYDGACSGESAQAVASHMQECEKCRDFYESLQTADQYNGQKKAVSKGESLQMIHKKEEIQKAASLKNVKKRLRYRVAAIVVLTVVLLAAIGGGIIWKMMNTTETVSYANNISVTENQGNLVATLSGTTWQRVRSVRAEGAGENGDEDWIFFYMTSSAWDDFVSESQTCSEYVLCFSEKGAESVKRVYYYTGDYSELSEMTPEVIEKAAEESVLLWEK